MLKLIITTISKNHIITFLMASWQLIDNQRGPQNRSFPSFFIGIKIKLKISI